MTLNHVSSHQQTNQQFLKKTKTSGDVKKRVNNPSLGEKEDKTNETK